MVNNAYTRAYTRARHPFTIKFSSYGRFYGLVNQRRPVIRGQFIGSVRRAERDADRRTGGVTTEGVGGS